jgi:hypothetical protein
MSTPSEDDLIDYFIFDAEDIDIGTFSRAKTDEVAAHFGINERTAFRLLDALAKKGVLMKTRDTMKRHKGKTAVGYQWWEYYWKPGDRERWEQRNKTTEESMTRKRPAKHKPERKSFTDPRRIGAAYAQEQLNSDYFRNWVYEQIVDAEQMRQADPDSVLPLETHADARKVAKNMLQQLGWDTKRELNESKEFFEGFDEELKRTGTVEWLAKMLLETSKDVRRVDRNMSREAYGRRGRYPRRDSDAVEKHKRYEEEWKRLSAEYRAKTDPLKAGLVEIDGQDLRSRGLQVPSRSNEVLIASLSDPRKGNEPVAHFYQYPGFGYGESFGFSSKYYVEPSLVPAGREAREARGRRTGKVAPYYSKR